MRRHGVAEIERAFAAIDAALDQPLKIIVIGGAAVALVTRDASIATKDVDSWQLGVAEHERLRAACAGIDLEIGPATVAEMPWNFEDRIVRILPELVRLQVSTPEPHDLALSKILRWYDGDEHQIRHLHAHRPLDPNVLVDRFRDEITHVTGVPRRHRENLIAAIDALFGALAAARADAALA